VTENVVGNAVIKAAVDSTGVESGVERVGKSLDGMAARAKAAAGQASQAVGAIGGGSDGAADKLDRTTQRIVSQIERVTAAARAGGRDTAAYFESIAQARGANLDSLRPYLDQLKQAQELQRGAGMSAAQMANNMRMVGPQITDIVTQLAGGQAPLQVFIQQGGQLKDMFGGIAPAAKALSASLMSLVNPYTVVGAGVLALAVAYKQGSAEADAYTRALILSGNAAGTNSSQLTQMARNLQSATTTQGAAAAALVEMAGSGKIAAENLQQFAGVAASMNRLLGTPLAETRKQFEELGKSPTEAVIKLNDATNFLTASTLRQIKSLEDQGKAAQAAQLAGTAYADAMDGRMKNLEASLGLAERGWLAIKDAAKGAWDAMLNIGREKTLDDRLGAAQQRLAELQQRAATPVIGVQSRGAKEKLQTDITGAQEQVNLLMRQALLLDKVSQAEADRKDTVAATASFLQLQEQMLTNVEKREREIAKARELGARAGASQVEVERVIAGIRAKYQDKKPETGSAQQIAKEYEQGVTKLLKVQSDLRDKTEETTKSQQVLNELVDHGLNTWPAEYQKVIRAIFELGDAEEKTAKTRKAAFDALVAQINTDLDASEKNADTNETLRRQLADLELSTRKLGATKSQLLEIEQQDLDLKIEAAQIDLQLAEIAGKSTAALETQIVLLRQLKDARSAAYGRQQTLDTEQAGYESLKRQQEAAQKSADDINRALTDSLFRAAESGKGAFQTLRDSIHGMFNNMVLKPIVQAAFAPISGAISGATQGVTSAFGTSFAGSSAGSLLGGGSLFAGGISNMGANFAFSGLGQSLGLSTPAVAEAMVAAELTSSGAVVSAIGTAVPWIAAAIALYSIFGGSKGGPKVGGSATANLSGLLPDATRLFTPNQRDSQLATTTTQLVKSVDKLATTFGGSAANLRIALGFDTDPNGKAQNRVASYVQTASGMVPFLQSGRDVGTDANTLTTELATEGKRVMLAALQSSDLQNGFADIFARLDPATAAPEAIDALVELATKLNDLGEAAKQLPGVMGSVAELSATAREALVGFAGGLDAFVQNQAGYYQNFYSVEERAAQSQTNLTAAFASLGVAFDKVDTRTEFRNLVEGLDLTDSAQAALYGGLLKLQQPLSDWIAATDTLTQASKDAADALTRQSLETRQTDLTGQISDLTTAYGDLSKSLDQLENPARTVAQQFIDLGTEISNLDTEMRRILGTAGMSLTDQLSASVNARAGIFGAQSTLQDTRNSTIVQQFLDSGDKQGAVDFLNTMFDWLVAAIPTADNPADFAARATSVLTQRANIQASITTDAAQTELDNTRTARELRISGLETEIENLRTMAGVADDIARTLTDLRTGSLSALSPIDQLAASRSNFESILMGAQGGDVKALQQLTGSASGYLQEAQSFFASGGNYAGTFDSVTNALDAVGTSLADVPTQLSVAQEQLETERSTKDAAVTTATNTGDILTGIGTIETALGSALTTKNTTLENLTTAINNQISAWNTERDSLRGEFDTVRDAYRQLVDDLDQVKRDLARIAGDANLAAAAPA